MQQVSKSTYYNFDTAQFGYGVFDVSSCSPNADKFYFRMGFPIAGIVAPDELLSVKFIENLVYNSLTSTTRELPTRFSRPQVFPGFPASKYEAKQAHFDSNSMF